MKKTLNIYGAMVLIVLLTIGVGCNRQIASKQFIRSEGKVIVDSNGDNFIFRGLGPGGWMLQEGYMIHTKVGTQYEIRNMLEDLTDKETTDAFYEAWLNDFFTEEDVQQTKEWGFNSIRVPIHYNLFTLAIEDEPIKGEQTWLDLGFTMLDELVEWCEKNSIYLIIDLHAAPGGQGVNASISDYDTSKPSLWESEENQAKMVALWQKIANRYKNNTWVAGYDLLNETNWAFDAEHPNGCDCDKNAPILMLFQQTIDAIRKVDKNHIIFVEGNCWANNFKGLHSLASYDENIVFSFHKYWNENTQKELDWVVDLRDSLNVPLYLGETGENSNTWLADMVNVVEANNISWSQWAYKQMDNDDPYTIVAPLWNAISDYNPKTGENKPSEDDARAAMAEMLNQIKTENCRFNPGVINAYVGHVTGIELKHENNHKLPGILFASDYATGEKGSTWHDVDYQNIHSLGTKSNRGGVYRNDGVDVFRCNDDVSNGYYVGHTEKGEWMKYTISEAVEGNYDIILRYAGELPEVNISINGSPIKYENSSATIAHQTKWKDVIYHNLPITASTSELMIEFEEGGAEINYLKFNLLKAD